MTGQTAGWRYLKKKIKSNNILQRELIHPFPTHWSRQGLSAGTNRITTQKRSGICFTSPENLHRSPPPARQAVPHGTRPPLPLVMTPSSRMTLAWSNWPMVHASARKQRCCFAEHPARRVWMATGSSRLLGSFRQPLQISPNSPAWQRCFKQRPRHKIPRLPKGSPCHRLHVSPSCHTDVFFPDQERKSCLKPSLRLPRSCEGDADATQQSSSGKGGFHQVFPFPYFGTPIAFLQHKPRPCCVHKADFPLLTGGFANP